MPKGASKTIIPTVLCKQYGATDFFAGIDTAEDHLQDSPSSKTFDIMVTNEDTTKSIVLHEVHVACTPNGTGTTPFIGTLAESNSSNDLLVFCPNRLWTYKYSSPIKLTRGTNLIHYHVQAADTGTGSLNTIQILYSIENA